MKLDEISNERPDLFGVTIEAEKKMHIYESMDEIRKKYGKHTLFLGSSLSANTHAQHAGDRGEASGRSQNLLPYETKRKCLGIPMFLEKLI